MSRAELDVLLESAAKRGATLALERVGLQDEGAGRDVFEMRNFIDAYRDIKKGALATVGKVLAILIIGGIALWLGKPGLLLLAGKS